MKTNELARRYAMALFLVAEEKGITEKVGTDLETIKTVFEKDDEVSRFFTSPVFSPEVKAEMLKDPLKKMEIDENIVNLILVAVRKGRLEHIPYIANAFGELVDDKKGVVRGTVRSASMLSDENKNQLKKLIGDFVNRDVDLVYQDDQSLIGGMIAEVGGWTFDDSIDSHLTRLKENLNRSVH